MTFPRIVVGLMAVILASGHAYALTDAIMPDALEYVSGVAEDDEARICEIKLTITNSTSPERVAFIAFVGYDKLENSVATGFLIGAASLSGAGELELITILSGAFNSETFDSPADMDHEIYGDGTIMVATADREIAGRFLKSVAAGGFLLFLSSDQPASQDWTYRIEEGPPPNVQQHFAACLDSLIPSTVSLRYIDWKPGRLPAAIRN